MTKLAVFVLGGFNARIRGRPLILPTKKCQGLLAYLALRPSRIHAREKLATLPWGDTADQRARHNLRQALFDLRRALPRTKRSILQSNGNGVAVNASAVDVDAVKFERLVTRGTPDALTEAMTLYRGDLLEGLSVQEEPWDEWLRTERERLRGLAVEATKRLLAHQTETGLNDAAIQTAERLLALDSLQEDVHRSLMRLYVKQDRRAAALRQYQICLQILQRELGVEPQEETRRLYQELLRHRMQPVVGGGMVAPRGARRQSSGPRSRRSRATLETRLVGREPEMVRLRQALEDAWSGRGRVVAILGEAGTGKTRLIDELTEIALRRGGRVVLGRCYETEQIFPYGPWADLLRTAVKDQELDDFSPICQVELGRLLPELGEPGSQAAASVKHHRRLFDNVVQLVRHLAIQQPHVLLIDDLHWADEMSVRLLSFLGRRIEGAPILVVGTARDEELDGVPLLKRVLDELDRDDHLLRLALSPLIRPHSVELVQALTGSAGEGFSTLSDQVWEASEGNPFMIVETVRSFWEGAAAPASGHLPMPQRVKRLISSRVERLTERAQQLATVAAVIGREFEFTLLQQASRIGEAESAAGVEELVRRRVLHGAGGQFSFSHDRIREVVYSELLAPSRQQLHASVARAIEELYAEDLAPTMQHWLFTTVRARSGRRR